MYSDRDRKNYPAITEQTLNGNDSDINVKKWDVSVMSRKGLG